MASQAVVAFVMEVVGLGGGDQDPVDAAGEEAGQQVRPRPGRKQARISVSARSRSATAGGTGIDRLHGVDEHDLAVEPGDVLAEERFDHMRLVGLVAPLHHGGKRARGGCAFRQAGGSGAKVSAGEPSRSPGIRKRPGGSVDSARSSLLAGAEIVGEGRARRCGRHLVGGRFGIDASCFRKPGGGEVARGWQARRDRSESAEKARKSLPSSGRSRSHSPG